MRFVVAGGAGFLGSALVSQLQRDGHDVHVLTRGRAQPGAVVWSPNGSVGPWADVIDDADVVVNLAGESIADGRWTSARKARILQSRIDATRSLVGAISAVARKPSVFLSGSAVGFYGPHDNATLDESSPPGADFLATVCVEWEKEAQRAAHVTRVVLLRTGLVLHTSGGALPQIARPFKLFAGGPVGSGRQYWSWIHRDDWVGLAIRAARDSGVSGPLNLTAPAPVTNREFAATLGRVLGRPSFMPAPAFALRLLLGEMADALLLTGQRVVPSKARAAGFDFTYSTLEPALRALY